MEPTESKVTKVTITPTPQYIWRQIVWDYVMTIVDHKGRKTYKRGRCDTLGQVHDLMKKIEKQNAHEFRGWGEEVDRYAEP